jgi:hypothetical protein
MTNPQLSSTPSSDRDLLSREIDEQLLHLRGLILVRRILQDRGATQAELDDHTDQIQQLRSELARTFAPSRPLGGPAADSRTAASHRPRATRQARQLPTAASTLNAA